MNWTSDSSRGSFASLFQAMPQLDFLLGAERGWRTLPMLDCIGKQVGVEDGLVAALHVDLVSMGAEAGQVCSRLQSGQRYRERFC